MSDRGQPLPTAYYNILQHTTTYYNVLQRTTSYYNVLHCATTSYNVLQRTTKPNAANRRQAFSKVQNTARNLACSGRRGGGPMDIRIATYHNVLQRTTTYYIVLQSQARPTAANRSPKCKNKARILTCSGRGGGSPMDIRITMYDNVLQRNDVFKRNARTGWGGRPRISRFPSNVI